MKKIKFSFEYLEYQDVDELTAEQAEVLKKALAISKQAYVPYSNFHVGAALELENGKIFASTNQENASYPVGTCAERGLLVYVSSQFPNAVIKRLAVSTEDLDQPLPPCGMCRQAILEYEKKQKQPIEIILAGKTGVIHVLASAKDLLPLHFDDDFLEL
ncbi:cytidine deaminase [Vaginella massiliensis]|uniref:cytidine deaminase n=1 Tax=Vaginella massiliensis TaxID=1816680 RepID=UPI000839B02F|nr:cytidine deaminase [Vaginella massiliensis]